VHTFSTVVTPDVVSVPWIGLPKTKYFPTDLFPGYFNELETRRGGVTPPLQKLLMLKDLFYTSVFGNTDV